jgi:HPt (histidine-containing phosphotransfer) domain-containing protein
LAGLPARWQELEQAATVEDARMTLHRLSGVAGSYGFPQIGQLCVALSTGLESVMDMRVMPAYAQLGAAIKEAVQSSLLSHP